MKNVIGIIVTFSVGLSAAAAELAPKTRATRLEKQLKEVFPVSRDDQSLVCNVSEVGVTAVEGALAAIIRNDPKAARLIADFNKQHEHFLTTEKRYNRAKKEFMKMDGSDDRALFAKKTEVDDLSEKFFYSKSAKLDAQSSLREYLTQKSSIMGKTKIIGRMLMKGVLAIDIGEKVLVWTLTDRSPGYCAIHKTKEIASAINKSHKDDSQAENFFDEDELTANDFIEKYRDTKSIVHE